MKKNMRIKWGLASRFFMDWPSANYGNKGIRRSLALDLHELFIAGRNEAKETLETRTKPTPWHGLVRASLHLDIRIQRQT
jgi:hypothetical protein